MSGAAGTLGRRRIGRVGGDNARNLGGMHDTRKKCSREAHEKGGRSPERGGELQLHLVQLPCYRKFLNHQHMHRMSLTFSKC